MRFMGPCSMREGKRNAYKYFGGKPEDKTSQIGDLVVNEG